MEGLPQLASATDLQDTELQTLQEVRQSTTSSCVAELAKSLRRFLQEVRQVEIKSYVAELARCLTSN